MRVRQTTVPVGHPVRQSHTLVAIDKRVFYNDRAAIDSVELARLEAIFADANRLSARDWHRGRDTQHMALEELF